MLAAILVMAAACHRATVPTSTPVINTEIKNQNGQTILAGHASLSMMQAPAYKPWFDESYNNYGVDKASTEQLKPLLQNKRMEIFLGSWCGDSKREVPHMIKLLQDAGMDTAKLSLIFVNNSLSSYKQSPQHEEQGKFIHHVPTFIVYDGKKEMGRIIESPIVSLEKDLLAILQEQSYQPNYKAIEFWRNNISSRSKQMSDEVLQNLVSQFKPLCRHYGEFNTYGYVLMAAKNYEEAINVFKLNTMIYPETAGVFDSLGEAYATIGNNVEAKLAYEKVLALKPGDTNAVKWLEKLK